jgi:hypothetical protein
LLDVFHLHKADAATVVLHMVQAGIPLYNPQSMLVGAAKTVPDLVGEQDVMNVNCHGFDGVWMKVEPFLQTHGGFLWNMNGIVAFLGYHVHTEKALIFHPDNDLTKIHTLVLDHWAHYHLDHASQDIQLAAPTPATLLEHPYWAIHLDGLHHSLLFDMA